MITGAERISFIVLLSGISLLIASHAPAQKPEDNGWHPPHVPGALWTGIVDGKLTETSTYMNELYTRHYTVHIQVRLREYNKRPIMANDVKPPHTLRTVGWEFDLRNEGTRMENTFEDGKCSGKGVTTYSGDEYPDGYITWRSIDDAHVTSIYPFDINNIKFKDFPMEGTYGVGFGSCCWNSCSNYNDNKDHPFGLGHDAVEIGMGLRHSSNYEFYSVMNPPINHRLNAAHTKMSGSFDITNPYNDGVGSSHVQVRWDICKQGSSGCIPLDTTASPVDPCGNTANEDALLQVCINQQKAIEDKMGKIKEDQQKEADEAQSHFADFKLVVNLCKLWDKTKTLLTVIIGGPDFMEGLSPAEAAEFKEFQETVKLLTEMAGLAADGKNPMEALEPEEVKDLIEKGEKLNNIISQIDILLAGYTPESGAKALEDCSAPVSEDLRRSAEEYLKHLKASLDLLKEINLSLNDLRNKNNECLQKQWDAYAACVRQARCAGSPESACDNKKPPGNWPDVQ